MAKMKNSDDTDRYAEKLGHSYIFGKNVHGENHPGKYLAVL